MRILIAAAFVLGCSSSERPRVEITASAEVGPPKPLNPSLLPRWHREGGRARVVMALSAPQWDVTVADGGCLTAEPKSGDARIHVEWQDAAHHRARVVSWGHGSVMLGECAREKEWAIASEAAPVGVGASDIDPRDEVRAVPGPVGADAVNVYLTAEGPLVVAAPGATGGVAFLYLNDVWNDHDGDGLGADLEADLGTSDSIADTDEDGIDDGMEVMGYSVPPDPPQMLPAWGASPTHKDLFVEVDWEDDGGAAIGFVDGPSIVAPTADRFARLRADSIHNPDGQAGVALHVDNGVPSSGTTWGDWGGFSIIPVQPANTPDAAEAWGHEHAFFQSRAGVFHYALAHSRTQSGAWGYYPGAIVMTHRLSQSAFQEELGHNVGLAHHGAGRGINCKPNYRSHMNYAFNGDFSDGRFAGMVLNPMHLDETLGLGTGNAQDVAFLAGPPFYYNVRADGAIDWNRDGRFDTDVRAWINYPAYFGFSCENARYRIDGWGGGLGTVDPVRGALGRDGQNLAAFYGKDGHLVWRTMTTWVGCDPNDIAAGCGNWTGAHTENVMLAGGIAAASGIGGIQVVARVGDHLEHYAFSNSTLRSIGPVAGSAGALADPGLAYESGVLILLYGNAQGGLVEQRFDGVAWSLPEVQSSITVDRDTGASPANGPSEMWAATVSQGLVTILRRGASGWEVIPDAFAADRPQSDRAPALAWGRDRFYLMFRGVGASHVMRIDMTDASGRFALPALQDNIWAAAPAAPGLFYDDVGGNLRMVKPHIDNSLLIWPYADGLYDVDMHDVDDASIIRAGLCWALKGCGDPSCPPSPSYITPCGGTQPGMVLDWIDDLPQDD